ncbi:MAG: TIGR01620 family protein, partial [Pseudomonadota bacterium]
MSDRPVLIDLNADKAGPSPADAPPVAEVERAPDGQAMQTLAALSTRRTSRLAAWFWRLLLALVVFLAGVAAWDFLNGLLARSPVLAAAAMALFGLFLFVCFAIILREVVALVRLRRVDRFHAEAGEIRAAGDLPRARAFVLRLAEFYKGRTDVSWGAARLEETIDESFDAD